jgi:nitrogenase-associated protein
MAKIIFYEKTGCKNNTKQKQILALSGHEVEAVDVIQHQWNRDELHSFFKGLDPKHWFNLNAPAVSDGKIVPEDFDENLALEALLNEHILIKRPLMIIGDKKFVGFDADILNKEIGININAHPSVPFMLNDISKGCPSKNIPGSVCP